MKKSALIVRYITVPPVMAFALLTILLFARPDAFPSILHYIVGVFCLTVLPLLAYPVAHIKKDAADMRALERNLAIVFSVVGYIGGLLFSLLAGGTEIATSIFMTYTISGILTALLSFTLKIKSSGHACGAAGPIAALAHYLGAFWFIGFVILAAVYWCSLVLRRHTVSQLIIGSLVSIAAFAVSVLICTAIY